MRHCLWLGLLPVVLGGLVLLSLKQKKEALGAELRAIESSRGRQFVHSRKSQISGLNLEGLLRKNEKFQGGHPERWEKLSDLGLDDLKEASSWILSSQETPNDALRELPGYQAILDLVKELDPEWVLRELEKREIGTEYPWGSRSLAPQAFSSFLQKDRSRALQWYEDGLKRRVREFFDVGDLGRLAAGELLKSNPERAIEILELGDGRVPVQVQFPRFARLENPQQLQACVEQLRQVDNQVTRHHLQEFVERETYRMTGVAGLRDFINSIPISGRTGLKQFEILGSIVEYFESEQEMRGLVELAGEAPEEMRERAIAWVMGGLAYEDAPAAERLMRDLPPGEARELAFEKLIRWKSSYDSDRGYELLSEIEDEGKMNELRRVLDERGGEL